MPSNAVANRFEAYLVANWTATPIVLMDTIGEPPDADAFLVQQYPVVLGMQWSLDGQRFIEEGTLRLVLNVRRGVGTQQGTLWEDDLKNLFRRIKFTDIALETFVPDGAVIDDNSEQGNWITYSVVVPYRFQFESL